MGEDNYKDDYKIDGLLCQFIKCKCGKVVMCIVGKHSDGDLIDHPYCLFKLENNRQ